MKKLLLIIGSASLNSTNNMLGCYIKKRMSSEFNIIIFDKLSHLPHFVPELSSENTPQEIIEFRNLVECSDGVLVLTPEYIFSIPSGLKNAFEWCVSTTIFTNKPMGLITASANGKKGQEELILISQTLMANFTPKTTLLLSGIKGRVTEEGDIVDLEVKKMVDQVVDEFRELIP